MDRAAHKEIVKKQMDPFSQILNKRDYLLGDYLTYIDFIFLELCELADFIAEDFINSNKGVSKYVKRVKKTK